jgi:octaprenyl-diphosphate synthase
MTINFMHNLNDILGPYAQDLAQVQEMISSKLHSDAEQLTKISTYLSNLGGKKVRPLLAISFAKALGMDLRNNSPEIWSSEVRQLITVSAGIEMIHMATLLHDDIIDKSLVRRHQPSAYAKFGLEDTLLSGDFLLVRAFGLCGKLDPKLIQATEDACVALTEGEILEKGLPLNQVSLEQAIVIAQKKTAALFELASFSAAYLAGASDQNQNKAAEFGRSLGIGFQIVDDILDVISDDKVLGKPSGQDLREAKPSVINLLWIKTGTDNSRKLLENNGNYTEDWVADSLLEIKASVVPDQAREMAKAYFVRSKELLEQIAAENKVEAANREQHLSALRSLIDFAMERMH